MTHFTGFLLYASAYRLTVLAIGALSIYLGFRLFLRPPGLGSSAESTSSAGVQAGGFRLRVTNFFPGTYFALFGTVLIGLMIRQGPPQLTLKDIRESTPTGSATKSIVGVRDDPRINLDGFRRQASTKMQEQLNQEWEKLKKSGMTLSDAAASLSSIARIFQRQNRINEAVAMARLAYLYGPEIDKVTYLILFAELLDENGEMQKGMEARAELNNLRKKGK